MVFKCSLKSGASVNPLLSLRRSLTLILTSNSPLESHPSSPSEGWVCVRVPRIVRQQRFISDIWPFTSHVVVIIVWHVCRVYIHILKTKALDPGGYFHIFTLRKNLVFFFSMFFVWVVPLSGVTSLSVSLSSQSLNSDEGQHRQESAGAACLLTSHINKIN